MENIRDDVSIAVICAKIVGQMRPSAIMRSAIFKFAVGFAKVNLPAFDCPKFG